jgi:hypothetical protein
MTYICAGLAYLFVLVFGYALCKAASKPVPRQKL